MWYSVGMNTQGGWRRGAGWLEVGDMQGADCQRGRIRNKVGEGLYASVLTRFDT